MITADAPDALNVWARMRGLTLEELTPQSAIDLVLDWYAQERSDDAHPVDEDGDGILIQWGTYAFGAPPTFQFDVTRQFITEDEDEPEEDAIWQLHVTVHYAEDAVTEAVEGQNWLFDPADTASARDAVAADRVLGLLEGRKPLKVVVDFERAD